MRNYQFTPKEQRTARRFVQVGLLIVAIELVLFIFHVWQADLFVFAALMGWSVSGLVWGLYVWHKHGYL